MLRTSSRTPGLAGRSVVLAALLALAAAAHAQGYDFRILPLSVGYNNSGFAINARGDVVGSSNLRPVYATLWRDGTPYHLGSLGIPTYSGGIAYAINDTGLSAGQDSAANALLWRGLDPIRLPTPNAGQAAAYGLNNLGQAVGWSRRLDAAGQPSLAQATLWSQGTAIDLAGLGGQSQAHDINERGQVVGWSYLADSLARHAALWQDGRTLDLGTAGGASSWANAVNDAGMVVGASELADDYARAVVWHDGAPTVLGLPGAGWRSSEASGLNNAGQVVGGSLNDSTGFGHAMLWSGASVTDLNTFLSATEVEQGWRLVHAYGINDRGWITGAAFNALTYETAAYVLAPVPEPSSLGLAVAGLVVLGVMGGRRRRVNARRLTRR